LHKHRVKEKHVQTLSRWIDSLIWFFFKYVYNVFFVIIKYCEAQALQSLLKKWHSKTNDHMFAFYTKKSTLRNM
jgi:hypothetical protein